MSNGTICCIYGVCCYPPGGNTAKKALAEEMAGALSSPGGDTYESIANWLLDNFDLVPKGIAKAIIDGYSPEFAKLHGVGAGRGTNLMEPEEERTD